jgi:hypothetical protein
MIYIFNGATASIAEKRKGLEVAARLDDEERGGRAEVIRVNDDINNEEFWGILGGFVDPSTLPSGESDSTVVFKKNPPAMLKISDASGSLETENLPLEGNKLSRALLNTDDVYIIVVPTKVFIWIGKKSSLGEKKGAMISAMKYIDENPEIESNINIERVCDGMETSSFKNEFRDWNPPRSFGQQKSIGIAGKVEDAPIDVQKLLAAQEAEDKPVDDGTGKLEIWVINDFKIVPVEEKQYGQFYGGDSYIVKYTYLQNRVEKYIIYFWLGDKSTQDEKGSAALLAKDMDDNTTGGAAVQVRVTQGKEPAHFRQLFKGNFIVHSGGKASGFKNVNAEDDFDTDGVALFHVRGTNLLNTFGMQVAELASSLNSTDCFCLVTPATVFLWHGQHSNQAEIDTANNISLILAGTFLDQAGREVVDVPEGSESEEFWGFLGGKGEYAQFAAGEPSPKDPRLFSCSTATGSFKVEEVFQFEQEDLLDEDVFILDTYSQLFIWVGSGSTQEEKDKCLIVAAQFIENADDGRSPDIPVIRVEANNEPMMFTLFFQGWDFGEKKPYVDPFANKIVLPKATPAPVASTTTSNVPASTPGASVVSTDGSMHSYETLISSIPSGVNPAAKEQHLDASEFQKVFEMDVTTFNSLPKWKRDSKKKAVGLF